MKIRRASFLCGSIDLPGDKSISHRAAMIAAMAEGDTRIDNFATSADCASTLECVKALGVDVQRDGNTVMIKGGGKNGLSQPDRPLDCGNSGTTMRLMAGVLAGQTFESVLIGDESLQKRPMKRVIEPLGKMGAEIRSNDGMAPLTILGRTPLMAVEYQPPVASAQIKSCVLLAGLNSDGVTTVIEPVRTRDHTERMLEWFGVDVAINRVSGLRKISVNGGAVLTARNINIPADISSGAFFMVAAAGLAGSDITMANVGINPSRRAIFDVLADLGANAELLDEAEKSNEPVATIRVRGGLRTSASSDTPVLRGEIIANLIDEIPILAILGTQLDNGLEIRDAAELRVKESDRISAVVENLKRLGAAVSEFPDGFRVER
ncbi:MAG: 3-phosphoshikimate 1-carboxyvinyltransferase, partial [Pyrinomonadaceae bacterium]